MAAFGLVWISAPVTVAQAQETSTVESSPAQEEDVTETAPENGGEDSPLEPPAENETPEPTASPLGVDVPEGPELAGGPRLEYSVTIKSDGTPDFDSDDQAGNDSSANNGIVRVNDTVTYKLQYSVNEGVGENARFTLALPKGMEFDSLPSFCLAGSSLTPESVGVPSLPLSADSIDELAVQTLECNVGSLSTETQFVEVTAKVLNYVHNGQTLKPERAGFQVDNAPAISVPESDLPELRASARLKWDISLNSIALEENKGYVYGPSTEPCPWDNKVICKRTGHTVLISAPAGGKGAMPAIGDITFDEDLSFRSLYPGLQSEQYAKLEAEREKYGSRAYSVGTYYSAPGNEIGTRYNNITHTEVNSVRNSGKLLFDNSLAGQAVPFRVVAPDMSLRTYPKQVTRPHGNAIPGNQAYAVSHFFSVYTPVDTIREFGIKQGTTWTLDTRNWLKNLEIRGFTSADVQHADDQPTWNDHRDTTPNISFGARFNKVFTGVPGEPGNMLPELFSPGYAARGEGPPGGATLRSGGITVAPTQNVLSQLEVSGSNPDSPGDISIVLCDSWDNSRLHLQSRDVPANAYDKITLQSVPSQGAPVWVSGYNNVPDSNNNDGVRTARAPNEVPAIKVQYSPTAGGSREASECGDAQGPWFDNPADVPGNDAAQAQQGIYTGVARVRVHSILPAPVSNSSILGNGVRMAISINQRVADSGHPAGDIIPNWASIKVVAGSALNMQETLAANTGWTRSDYAPEGHTGSPGDRLILGLAQVRVDKKVRRGTEGEFTDTPPRVSGGGVRDSATGQIIPADTVQYLISPSLTSGVLTPGILKDVWVEDCLPSSQVFIQASRPPVEVVPGSTPSDAKRNKCRSDETYIRWIYPKHEINRPIEPIILTTEVSPIAKPGVYNNVVQVWAEGDASSIPQRMDDAQVQINNIAGIKLEKLALTPEVQVNREGQQHHELNKWRVTLANTLPKGGTSAVQNPDIIDVLPKNGVAGSQFQGTFEFVSAKVLTGDSNVRILYTKDANVDLDQRNNANVTWCESTESNDASCPQNPSEVTALRIQRPGSFDSGDTIAIELAMKGIGNARDNIYVNRVFAAAEGLQYPVGPIANAERVIESEIGDLTWWDTNRNGKQDNFNGEPEPLAENVEVRLEGTDDLGNQVALQTTTNASGRYLFNKLRASNGDGYTITFRGKGSLTQKNAEGVDAESDSNADQKTGASDPVVLNANSSDYSIDAGFVTEGSLVFAKLLKGVGVEKYAPGDRYEFKVTCTLGDKEVVNKTITMVAEKGKSEITAEPINNIPAEAVCKVTETNAGRADQGQQETNDIKITWNPETGKGNQVAIALTNNYSAGAIRIAKRIEGEDRAKEAALTKEFRFDVICQMEANQPPVLHIQGVTITGENTVDVLGEDGQPAKLPKGARCFATETESAGAIQTVIDHKDFNTGALIDPANPNELAQITITATNTFEIPRIPVKVSKVVVANGSEGSNDFKVDYRCTAPGRNGDNEVPAEGTVQVTGGSETKIGDFPVGTECQLTGEHEAEIQRQGYTLGINLGETVQVAEPGVTLVATNTYTRDHGSFSITKHIIGDEPDAIAEKKFLIEYKCVDPQGKGETKTGALPVSVAGGPVVAPEIPTGWECTLTENKDSAQRLNFTHTKGEIQPAKFTVEAKDTEVKVAVTNEYTRDHGTFSVAKKVTGDNAETNRNTTFKVNYVCGDARGVLEVPGNGTTVPGPQIPVGTQCEITEDLASAQQENHTVAAKVTPSTFTVTGKDSVTKVEVSNEYKRHKGGVTLTKEVKGDATTIAPKEFNFEYTCTGLPAGEKRQAKVTPGKITEITDLPTGTCTFTERASSAEQGASAKNSDHSVAISVNGNEPTEGDQVTVDVEKDTTVTVHAINTYTVHRKPFEILKEIEADVAKDELVARGVFTFKYICKPPFQGLEKQTGTLNVRADGKPVASPPIPVGSKCTVEEDAASAAEPNYDVQTAKPETFTIGEGEAIHRVTAKNVYTHHRGTFEMAKLVEGVNHLQDHTFAFHYECTDGTKGTLEVKGNGKAAASNAQIQVGAICRVWEDVDRAQQPGLTLRPVSDMEFKIKQKGQKVVLSAVNHYTPPNTPPGIPLIPLIPLIPPLNPVVPAKPTPPADNGNVVARIVRQGQQLAKTGVSNLIIPMTGISLVLVVGGLALVLVRRNRKE